MTGRIFDNLPENLRKTVILLKKTSTVGRIDLGCGYRQISPIITQMKMGFVYVLGSHELIP